MTDWETKTLGSVCDMISRGVAPVYVNSGGIRVVNQKCVRDHVIDYGMSRRHDVSAKAVASERFLRVGDVLVNSTGTGTLGRVASVRVEPDQPTTVDTHVTIVRPKLKIFDPNFFGYAMITIEAELATAGEGASGQTELARSKLENFFTVRFPTSIVEQKRIVFLLNRILTDIVKIKCNTEKIIEKANILFTTARHLLFIDKGREWDREPLINICENLDGLRRPVTKCDRIAGEVPYYGASGIVDHVRDHLFDEELLLVSEDGANLLMRTYPIAFSISGPAWVNNHAHVLRFSNHITRRFVEYYLNSIDLKPFTSGMAQPKLNQSALNGIEIPLPPMTMQYEIVAKLDVMQAEVLRLSGVFASKIAALAELKQSLLTRIFSSDLMAHRTSASRPANDNVFSTPEQVANVLAFVHWRHEVARRDKTFGHTKAQKALHLVESVGGVELGRRPVKAKAGPNDFSHMLKAEAWAKQHGFFEFVKRSAGGYDFVKLEKHGKMLGAAKLALKPIEEEVVRVADLLLPLDFRDAEVLATVHAAWNNLLLDGREVTDDAILYEARENWHPGKLDIPEAKFHAAIRMIREKGIVPDGSAKRVPHEQMPLPL